MEWPPPYTAWVTTAALDMGQAEGKHGGRTHLRTKSLFLLGCDVYLIKPVWLNVPLKCYIVSNAKEDTDELHFSI